MPQSSAHTRAPAHHGPDQQHPDRRRPQRVAIATLMIVGLVGAATTAAHAEVSGRYTMSPTEGGMLKLDTATGAVSFCTRTTGEWACTPTKDGEQTLRRRIEGLEGEVTALREQLDRLDGADADDLPPPRGPRGGLGERRGPLGSGLPTEKEVDQAFDYLERMMKTIRDRLKRLEERQAKPGGPL